jgi:nucleotide-binding universal stress UspA family protein
LIKRVLVPLDGSELSESILPFAAEIAERAGAEILLVTAVQPVGVWDATATAINWEREEKAAKDYIRTVEQRMTAQGHNVRSRAFSGDAAEVILDAAEKEEADLVTMTTHGRSGVMRWLLGSIADRVVQHARVPVMLVRTAEGQPLPSPAAERILVPLDGSETAAGALPFVKDYAELFDASLILFHAVSPVGTYPGFETANAQIVGDLLDTMQKEAEEMLAETAKKLKSEGLKVETAVTLSLAADGILEAAEKSKAGLIAIGTHGRSGITRAVVGSVANAVLRRSKLPCLLVHPTGSKS